jgi:hypothetical protein
VATSSPASLLARALGYQVLARGALVKSLQISLAPAEPSTALVAVQDSGWKDAPMRIGTLLVRVAPQMSAARWKAIRRCWPSVVPAVAADRHGRGRVVEAFAGRVLVDDHDGGGGVGGGHGADRHGQGQGDGGDADGGGLLQARMACLLLG